MAAVRVKLQGQTVDNAEIENIATEDTLSSILEQLKILNKSQTDFSKYAKDQDKKDDKKDDDRFDKHFGKANLAERFRFLISGKQASDAELYTKIFDKLRTSTVGGKATESAVGGIGGLASELPELAEALGALIPEIELAAAAFAALDIAIKVASSIAHAAGALTSAFVDGETSLSKYTGVLASLLDKIPVVGIFADFAQQFIEMVEKWNNTLYQLNAVGASFHESLTEMRQDAADMGISLEKFAGVITKNASSLASFGNVMEGVNRYVKISAGILQTNSQKLLAMGINMDQFNDELPTILSLLTTGATAQNVSNETLQKSALGLVTQFNELARLTGKSREDQEKQLVQQQNDAAFQIANAKLNSKQQAELTQTMGLLNSWVSESAGNMMKLSTTGMPAVTKEMIALQTQIPGLRNVTDELMASIRNGTYTSDQAQKAAAELAATQINWISRQKNLAGMAGQGISDVIDTITSNALPSLMQFRGLMDQNGQVTAAQILEQMRQVKTQTDANDAIKKSLDDFSLFVQKGQAALYSKVILPFAKFVGDRIGSIDAWFEKHPLPVGKLYNALDWAGKELSSMFKWLFAHMSDVETGLKTFVTNLPTYLEDLGKLFGVLHKLVGWLPSSGSTPSPAATAAAHAMGTSPVRQLGNAFAGGTVSKGQLIHDFGKETPATLHGREAVLTEAQLENLVRGSGPSMEPHFKKLAEQNQMIIDALQNLNSNSEAILRSNREIARAVK